MNSASALDLDAPKRHPKGPQEVLKGLQKGTQKALKRHLKGTQRAPNSPEWVLFAGFEVSTISILGSLSKFMVPFWVLHITRHLVFGGPQKGP